MSKSCMPKSLFDILNSVENENSTYFLSRHPKKIEHIIEVARVRIRKYLLTRHPIPSLESSEQRQLRLAVQKEIISALSPRLLAGLRPQLAIEHVFYAILKKGVELNALTDQTRAGNAEQHVKNEKMPRKYCGQAKDGTVRMKEQHQTASYRRANASLHYSA